jgi:hypothetical protein
MARTMHEIRINRGVASTTTGWLATCSCGWVARYSQPSMAKAEADGDEHVIAITRAEGDR